MPSCPKIIFFDHITDRNQDKDNRCVVYLVFESINTYALYIIKTKLLYAGRQPVFKVKVKSSRSCFIQQTQIIIKTIK